MVDHGEISGELRGIQPEGEFLERIAQQIPGQHFDNVGSVELTVLQLGQQQEGFDQLLQAATTVENRRSRGA